MRTLLIFCSALALAACSGDDEDPKPTTGDTGAPTGDDDDDDDTTADPIQAILALDGDEANGMSVYEANCSFCHSADGSGGTGSDLRKDIDPEVAIDVIYNGKGIMGDFGSSLTQQEIADVAAYVATFAP